MAQITCRNLVVGYNGKTVLNDINFEVKKGDYLCIIGSNGAGKTTLMRTLLGLIPKIGGHIDTGDGFMTRNIGYLPQQSEHQRDFPASVMEVVTSGFHNKTGIRPFYSKIEKKTAIDNLKKLGITNLENHPYSSLSGGQQQRVLLARALCSSDGMLVLDEPVAGLDPEATLLMYSLIEKLNKEGTTIVMISHDLDAVEKYATHVLQIGNEIFFGTKQEFKRYCGDDRRD
ncbi:MAG: metal ABC transporter ATP-binding protein [Sphaerochaeta sp.]